MGTDLDLVITVLLGILALSAPAVLSFVLFRVLVRDGVPLDSQKFRHNHSVLFLLFWPMMVLPGLFGILFGGTALIPDRLRAASITLAVILILVFSWFFFNARIERQTLGKTTRLHKGIPASFLLSLSSHIRQLGSVA